MNSTIPHLPYSIPPSYRKDGRPEIGGTDKIDVKDKYILCSARLYIQALTPDHAGLIGLSFAPAAKSALNFR
jgi:hypothetical protein